MTGGRTRTRPPATGSPAPDANGATRRPVEVELKYTPVTKAAGERVLAARELAGFTTGTPVGTIRMEDHYLDTAERSLARAGFAARLRTKEGATIVSVKSTVNLAPTGDGPHRREELEGPADPAARPSEWPASDARSLVLELSGDAPLTELVAIRQVRRRRVLRDERAAVELSLDDVKVVADGRTVDGWVELEIELVEGDERRLLDIAAVLDGEPDLPPVRQSKLERALAAVGMPLEPASATEAAATPAPEPSDGPGVRAADTVAEAGRKVLRFHFERMLGREAGVRAGDDIEDVHKMRVATRRMRAAWRIFGSGFRPRRTRRLRRELRRLARRLGAVRDLDVLLEGLDAYRADLAPAEQAGLEPLAAGWRDEREHARERLIAELESGRYRRFVGEMRAFLEADHAAVREPRPTEPHLVRDTAPSRIWTAYEQVRAYEAILRGADTATLHELRIAAKWLRYGIEFVREPLGGEGEALVRPVVALQDHLGLLHDADVAAATGRRLVAARSAELGEPETAALDGYVRSRDEEVERLRRSVGRPWRAVAGLEYRRRLGRAAASL